MEIRQQECKFKSKIFAILRSNQIMISYINWQIDLSSDFEDTALSYDMKFMGEVKLSVRIRKNEYLKYRDVTIRCKSKKGYECEIDKLKKGLGQIYFYAWLNEDSSDFADWVVFDINKIRHKLNEGIYRENFDGTAFNFYSLSWLKANNAIIKQPA